MKVTAVDVIRAFATRPFRDAGVTGASSAAFAVLAWCMEAAPETAGAATLGASLCLGYSIAKLHSWAHDPQVEANLDRLLGPDPKRPKLRQGEP